LSCHHGMALRFGIESQINKTSVLEKRFCKQASFNTDLKPPMGYPSIIHGPQLTST